jgi:U3 small nucleolar RNA-associated protein 12
VTALIILPGNKYVVMGTKEGSILLYDLQANELIQEVIEQAHTQEVWELAMHTNPQIKDARGNLLIASASSDKTIKFWTLIQSAKTFKV